MIISVIKHFLSQSSHLNTSFLTTECPSPIHITSSSIVSGGDAIHENMIAVLTSPMDLCRYLQATIPSLKLDWLIYHCLIDDSLGISEEWTRPNLIEGFVETKAETSTNVIRYRQEKFVRSIENRISLPDGLRDGETNRSPEAPVCSKISQCILNTGVMMEVHPGSHSAVGGHLLLWGRQHELLIIYIESSKRIDEKHSEHWWLEHDHRVWRLDNRPIEQSERKSFGWHRCYHLHTTRATEMICKFPSSFAFDFIIVKGCSWDVIDMIDRL